MRVFAMSEAKSRILSAREAARIIYNTPQPTNEQVGKVGEHLVRGHLKPSAKGGATTTVAAVAEFMAASATHRAGGSTEDRKLSAMYRGLLGEYFLAVVARRKFSHRSKGFEQAVLAGQILVLLVLVAAFVGGFRLARGQIAPERVAVERWLAENTEYYRVEEWKESRLDEQPGGMFVRVKYAYRNAPQGKQIITERSFVVRDGQATPVVESDE
jgi:hypothetical protein